MPPIEAKEIAMSGKTLTRADLSEAVHKQVGLSRAESADLVKAILDSMTDTLVTGETVKLSSFGTFMVRSKTGRIGRNPKTGEEVPITPRRVLVFRPSQVMKNVINGEEPGTED
jgi:integration host factor subunit alpha